MYKILIRYNDKHNLWQSYGTTILSASTSSSFNEFETDDIEVLKSEILKLDAIYGHDAIKIVEDVTLKYSVDVILNITDNIENNEQTIGE